MEEKIRFEYFYGMQAEQYSFYRIPKVLFTSRYFHALSCEAKVLYGLMLDRMHLSAKNKWFDNENKVYIIFTIEDVMELLVCSKPKAVKIMAELDDKKGIGLIEKRRLGMGKANIIYVKNFMIEQDVEKKEEKCLLEQKLKNLTSGSKRNEGGEVPEDSQKQETIEKPMDVKNMLSENQIMDENVYFQKLKNLTSRSKENELLEVKKINPNKNNINKTDINNLSIKEMDEMDYCSRKDYEKLIKRNIAYDALCNDYGCEPIDEIVELILDTCCSNLKVIRVNGTAVSKVIVKKRFLQLKFTHIQYVQYCLEKNTTEIRNIRSYLLTALYNAPVTADHYYKALFNSSV